LGANITTYIVDRFFYQSGNQEYISQQNAGTVTPPAGFLKYLGFTSLLHIQCLAGDFLTSQAIEGFNTCLTLGWGTASASTITISFWVRSSLTGTFGGSS
jgi:hypothetical protein